MRNFWRLICIVALCAAFVGCSDRVAKEHVDGTPRIFPDYCGVTIPSGIAPLNFSIEGAEHLQVVITSSKSDKVLTASGDDHVEMDEEEWHSLTQDAGTLTVEVSAWSEQHPDGVTYDTFPIYVSSDTIDPWIMYRLIPPGYEGWNKMGIYQRNLSNFEERVITDNTDNGHGCMNCHAACQGNPDNFTFHSRSNNGGTVILHKGNLEKVELKSLPPGLQGSYNAWHPSARWIAFSSNVTLQSFMARSRDKIEGYDMRGDIILYDVEHHKVVVDERFTDSLSLESFPSFSPDGKWLYFVSAPPVEMPMEYEKLRYSILRAPFNEDTGALGAVDTIFSADREGRSAIIPRISPDGQWLMYSTSPSGALNLYHNDADLGMIQLYNGDSVDCTPLNSDQSESYHSWSRNSRWVMFSSKRIDGRFTRLYFSHWDGKTWTKPFLLPQKDPKENTLRMTAYNVPDFIVKPVKLERNQIRNLIGPKDE